MDCGGCLKGGYHLVFGPDGRFCMAMCGSGPPPVQHLKLSYARDPSDQYLIHFTASQVTPPDATVTFDFGDGDSGQAAAVNGTAVIDHIYPRIP